MPDPLQRALGLLLGALTLPLVAVLALAVKLDSRGPALYRAERVGDAGGAFTCLKLRSMTWRPAAAGPGLTTAGDAPITRVGRLLRRYRLDELPQLWNVARGEMRLVGPRPEDPRYVEFAEPLHRLVFTARPGITGLTQLVSLDEDEQLAGATDPETHYREAVLPAKLRVDAAYLRHRSPRLDLWILAQTPRALLGRPIALPPALRAELDASGAAHGALAGAAESAS